jgi:uncharacterized membrane protein
MLMFYLIVLRFVHVIASVCWAGGAFFIFLFVEPSAKALAPSGMQFFQHMIVKRRASTFMVISSSLTVLSGALLLWHDASGQWLTWMKTGPGLGFTLGSLAGAVVYFVGMFGVSPRTKRIAKLGADIQAAGGSPTAEQGAEMLKLDKELSRFGYIDFVLVALSLALMGTARYWLF